MDDTNARPETGSTTPAGSTDAHRSRPGLLTIGRALAVTASASLLIGLILGPIISNRSTAAADPATTPEHTVTVSGIGQVSVAPDVADIVLGVSVQKPTVAAAQSAAAGSMDAVIAAVQKRGVAAKDIVTVNLYLSPVYDYSTSGAPPKIVGQQFTNTVRITVRSISNVAAVLDDAIAAGATTVQGITFRVGDPKSVQTQARQIAMADARSKADALTNSAGVSVKGVASISEYTTQTTPVPAAGYAMDAKAASTPIQTGTTDVIIQVTVSYLIG
jgi:uncharacterized protein YggE